MKSVNILAPDTTFSMEKKTEEATKGDASANYNAQVITNENSYTLGL